MNQLICHRCGGTHFTAVEFRNTRRMKISMGTEQVSLICDKCHLVVWNVEGRANTSCVLKKQPKATRTYMAMRR